MGPRGVRLALLAAVASGLLAIALPGARAALLRLVEALAAGDLAGVRDHLRGLGAWGPLASFLLVQVQAVLAPLPSFPLMYANGLLFGTLWGGLLSWVSILVSALLCFGLARLGGRPLVERVASPAALRRADELFTRYGTLAVLLGRLVPLTAFDLLSYAAGLTPMRPGPFLVATGIGMTPAIFLTAALGEAGLAAPRALVVGLIGLGALAGLLLLVRPILARRMRVARVRPGADA